MKELKYVKTFEQFNIKNDELLEEGIKDMFKSKAEKLKLFIEKNKNNLEKLKSKIFSSFSTHIAKGNDYLIKEKKEKINSLTAAEAIDVLNGLVKAYENGVETPIFYIKNGKIIVGTKGYKTSNVSGRIGSNA